MSAEQRSRCMSRIQGSNTLPEIRLRKALHMIGLRYRLRSKLVGKPDIVFSPARTAVFIDGCFWHSCPEHLNIPKGNQEFWRLKLRRNVERDRAVDKQLRTEGWFVLRFWEHEIKSDVEKVAHRVFRVVTRRRLPS
jgi:DNA mismatch endonuclease, patch repair protein